MSKSFFDSMLPKYTQFQPFINSQISSSTLNILTDHNNRESSEIAASNSNNLPLNTSTSEGNSLTGSEDNTNSPPTPASTTANIVSKMYPYVSNHPSSHTSLSGMPAFSGLDDKSCR